MAKKQQIRTRLQHVLEDPSSQAVAKVYAESFLGAATTAGVTDALDELQSFLDSVFVAHPDFAGILTSRIVGRDEKQDLINRVIQPRGSEFFTNFLRVLARHDRMELLPLICRQVRTLQEQRSGQRRVQISSARPLSDDARAKIQARLKEQLASDPILEEKIDESLLGGIVIRIGDTVYDTSLRARMKQLRARLQERTLHEIQSGRDRFSHPEGN